MQVMGSSGSQAHILRTHTTHTLGLALTHSLTHIHPSETFHTTPRPRTKILAGTGERQGQGSITVLPLYYYTTYCTVRRQGGKVVWLWCVLYVIIVLRKP